MHHRKVFRNAGFIGLATLVSRILGFLRDILIAALLGTGPVAQAFFVAFRIPNLFRDITAEGAANSAIIPVLAEYKNQRSSEYRNLIKAIQFNILVILLSLSLTGSCLSPVLVSIIAPGFLSDPSLYQLTVHLLRWIFPFIFFVGLFGLNMSILHTEERFISTALGQPLFNLSMIISLLIFGFQLHQESLALIIGVWAGGLALLFGQIIEINRLGYKAINLRPTFHPGIKRILYLLGPRVLGTIIYHLNILADTILASLSSIVGEGGIAGIYYANRLMQFPLALFSVSVAQATLPRLSHLSHQNPEQISSTFRQSLELVLFLILPSAAFLAGSNQMVVDVLLGRGRFDQYSVEITSSVLFFYSLGLPFFAGIKMLVSGFHSLQDTKTPVKTAGISLVINIILNLILMFPLRLAGLALASSISGGINFLLLTALFQRRVGFISKEFLVEITKIVLSSAIVFSLVSYQIGHQSTYTWTGLLRAILVGAGGYLIGCGLFKIRMWRFFIQWAVNKAFGNVRYSR